ncbi:aldehyde ferredoxin oxidoreductase family protein [Desulfotomaculum varum]
MTKHGIAGQLLRVNLTDKTVTKEPLPIWLFQEYLGGRGLGAYFLTKEVDPHCDPLGRDNKLIFMNGPFIGNLVPGGNKVCVTFKSPLSNTYSYSLAGGHWGPELKFAGYDGLIIEGKAEEPVYLWIDDDKVEIRPANHLWGKNIHETDAAIKKELRDEKIHVAAIGIAGENLVKMACITSDVFREFGRGGCGAVMGSKNLKAIAVRGSQDVTAANTQALAELVEMCLPVYKQHPKAVERRQYGTNELVDDINNAGFMATKNFSEGFSEANREFEGPVLREKVVYNDVSCYACPIACSKNCAVESAKYGSVKLEGPEFETLVLLGSNCGLTNWEDLLHVCAVCDELGLDSMNAGGCVALAMECFEKGILTLADTNGLQLNFGNGEAEATLLEMIAKREGIGADLAEGVAYAAAKWGVPELAMHSKNMVPAAYDPRGAKGMGLIYATSPKGAHHMVGPVFPMEMAANNRFEEKGKGALVKGAQLNFVILDSLGICSTNQAGFGRPQQIEAFKHITGIELTEQELLFRAERIFNMEKMFNVKLGFSRKDDTLPKRFTQESMTVGPTSGQTVNLDALLDEYYHVMGWDNNGIPTREKLAEMGLA